MAKIKVWSIGEIFTWVWFDHIPTVWDPQTAPWHIVHEYTGNVYDYMAGINNWNSQFFDDPAVGKLYALALAAMPQLATDLCPVCRPKGFQFYGPLPLPRWNIYRGQQREPRVPCIYWDSHNPDHPPGYPWYYPYPFSP